MIEIYVGSDDIETALKCFAKKVTTSGLMKEMREHEYFMSKSEKRRLKVEEGKKRALKRERWLQEHGEGR